MMCNFIRTGAGKKSISTFNHKHSSQQSKLLEDIYKSKLEYFDIDKREKKEQRTIIWADSKEILDKIMEKREL